MAILPSFLYFDFLPPENKIDYEEKETEDEIAERKIDEYLLNKCDWNVSLDKYGIISNYTEEEKKEQFIENAEKLKQTVKNIINKNQKNKNLSPLNKYNIEVLQKIYNHISKEIDDKKDPPKTND